MKFFRSLYFFGGAFILAGIIYTMLRENALYYGLTIFGAVLLLIALYLEPTAEVKKSEKNDDKQEIFE